MFSFGRNILVAAALFSGILAYQGSKTMADTDVRVIEFVRFAPSHALSKANLRLSVDGILFSGLLLTPGMNGEMVYAIFTSGRKDGFETGYYPNGAKSFERNWIEGQREGLFISWWPNGEVKQLSTYQADLLEGPASEWFMGGVQARSFTYEAGKEEGPQMMWFEDGSVRANYHVKNGKRYGSIGTKGCGGDDLAGDLAGNQADNQADNQVGNDGEIDA